MLITLKIDDANLAHASVHSGSPGAAQGRNLLSTTALLSICSRHGWSSVGSIHGLGWVGCLSQQHANIRSFDEGVRVAQKVVHFSTRHIFGTDHQNVPIVSASFPETLNILVKSVSFCLERFQRYGVLKMYDFFGPPCSEMCTLGHRFCRKFGC